MNQNSGNSDQGFDFSKPGESIHFIGNYVVKYFEDPKQIASRVKRAQTSLNGYVPQIAFSTDTLFGYRKIEGETVYSALEKDESLADAFFVWCQNTFWNPNELDVHGREREIFQEACRAFYYDKTRKRLEDYWTKVQHQDEPSVVNGTQTPTLAHLLQQIDWELLTDGVPSRFHGDLQFDNVLATHDVERPFVLIDWRGDFGGLTEYGDLYYDLAKLYGGLTIAYSHVKKGVFGYAKDDNKVVTELPLTDVLEPIRSRFERFITQSGYDLRRVKILTGIIFLNMSPLHHAPFDVLLHHLGKATLVEALAYEEAKVI